MRPLRLTLHNFLSYRGEHAVAFDGVTLAALTGQNGAGKSSVIDGMRFALFGHTRGGSDGVITQDEQACRVEFEFALGEETYLVSRQRSRKGAGSTLLSFQMSNGHAPIVLDGKSVAETQRRIEETLRLTDDLFTVTACANQGNVAAFSQAKPAARKQVLSDILDLAAWEHRADAARQVGRDVSAEIAAAQDRLRTADERAAQVTSLQDEAARLSADARSAESEIATREAELGETQQARESLVRDREADQARRAEFDDLTSRLDRAKGAIEGTTSRLSTLERAAGGKDVLLDGIRRAEAAQTCAQELEAKRQEDERLAHEAELARHKKQAAETAYGTRVVELKRDIRLLRAEQETKAGYIEQSISSARGQAAVLERVPCVGTAAKLAGNCPLIEHAQRAKERLPQLEAELASLQAQTPWTEVEKQLVELEAAPVARAEKRRLKEIAAARAEISYDAKEHAEAKRVAGKLRELQESLGLVQRAEAQVTEVKTNLEALTADAKQMAERKAALEADLGAPRNWDAMLAQVERSLKTTQQALSDLRSRLQSFQQRRGAVEERLRGAEQAGREAEELRAALRESERRLQVLKVLAQAYGKSGIPALLIEQAVPDLEAVANDVLSVLSDGRMSLALRSQRETKAKTIQETLDIVIADERGERSYENFSGGETMRVDLALRIALSVLLASRAGARCELLVLDEAAAPLDTQGRAQFVECLQRVAERFATILVITHVEELKDLFPFRFEISKTAEGSRVQMIAA